MRKIDILAIDDEPVINEAIERVCRTEGLSVQTVETAEEAIEKLEKEKFRLIICDLMLPGLDGFQLLEELNRRNNKTPVIVISGYSTLENSVKAIKKGALDFLPKPFTFEELLSAVYRGLEYSQIVEKVLAQSPLETDDNIYFVSCPSKYFKLGHIGWVNLTSEGTAIVGVIDLYLRTIKTVKKVELLEADENIYQGQSCLKIIDEKDVEHPFISPVSGKIIERNERLLTEPSLLEKDPFFNGWVYKVIPTDLEYERKFWDTCGHEI